jgi:hypothetical protein
MDQAFNIIQMLHNQTLLRRLRRIQWEKFNQTDYELSQKQNFSKA